MTNLNFKVGQVWENRAGKKCVIYQVTDIWVFYVVSGYPLDDTPAMKQVFSVRRSSGRSDTNTMRGEDLLQPWREKITGWVCVYRDKNGEITIGRNYDSKLSAENAPNDTAPTKKIIACVQWTEGDGLTIEKVRGDV